MPTPEQIDAHGLHGQPVGARVVCDACQLEVGGPWHPSVLLITHIVWYCRGDDYWQPAA
jgi:hypothetical protein